jgi:hypothetical protein
MRENDNVLFFGYYFVRMYKINKRKEILNSNWESSIVKIINNAVPDSKELLEKYKNNKNQKTQFLNRHILNPMTKALKILKKHNYVLNYEFLNINTKNIFNDLQKLKVIFNYDKSKFELIQLND